VRVDVVESTTTIAPLNRAEIVRIRTNISVSGACLEREEETKWQETS